MKTIKEPCKAHIEFVPLCTHCQEQPVLIEREDVLGLMKLLEGKTSYYEMWKELKAKIQG